MNFGDVWKPLRDEQIAAKVAIICHDAQSLRAQHTLSLQQYGKARMEALKAGVPFPFPAPPASTFVELAKSLKTEPHPTLVELGLGDRPPAAFREGAPYSFEAAEELAFTLRQGSDTWYLVDELPHLLAGLYKVRTTRSHWMRGLA